MTAKVRLSVLITSIGGAMVPAALQELRKSPLFDYRIVGVNAGPSAVAGRLVDAFHVVPKGGSPEYSEALLDIVEKERVDVVLPWSDEEAFAVSKIIDELGKLGAKAVVSSPECLSLIADKLATYETLEANGIEVPEYSIASDRDTLRAAIEKYRFPERTVVVKPAAGRGGRGLFALCGNDGPPNWLGTGQRENRVQDAKLTDAELDKMIDGRTLVMPQLQVPAFDVDVLASKGKAIGVCVRERTNPTGIPYEGNRIHADTSVADYCRRVAEAIGLDSLHDIDLMTTADGEVRVLEVNPRPSGSLVASTAAGLRLMEAAIALAAGETPPELPPARDCEVVVFPSVAAG